MRPIWSQIVHRVLTRVVYFNLPDAAWERTPGMHRLDFGLDLEFGEIVVSATWGTGQALTIATQSLRRELVDAEAIDATAFAPWKDAVGRNVRDVVEGPPEPSMSTGGQPCPWSLAIEFHPGIKVWLAAANYVDPDYPDGWMLLPCGDELIVISDPEVAVRLGLATRIGQSNDGLHRGAI